jgi:integrase
LATLQSVLRFARRRGWVLADPVDLLEPEERPHPPRRSRGRVLGQAEIERLLEARPSRGRILVETALFSGLRISELLGLTWSDIDFAAGLIQVRAQLSSPHRGEPARRVAPKTPASVREVPLVPQLADRLAAHRRGTPFAASTDWVFVTSRGTPFGERNVARRVLKKAADATGLNDGGQAPLRFHDLRHTFASHLIVDLGLDVAQVSRILGHASITITLDVYTHLFDDIRHAREIRQRMAASKFASLLDLDFAGPSDTVIQLRAQ